MSKYSRRKQALWKQDRKNTQEINERRRSLLGAGYVHPGTPYAVSRGTVNIFRFGQHFLKPIEPIS
jgi:hypothetical protein